MMFLARLLAICCITLGGFCVQADENSNYFDASTITEYAHFLFDSSVGQPGFMSLTDPVLGENFNQWGSDREESTSSSTDVISPREFKQVGNNLFYEYHATYVMPENSLLTYQYLYFDFLPNGATFDEPQPSVISRNFFSIWIKSSVAQRFRVEFHFESVGKEKSDFVNIPATSTFLNLKIPVTNAGALVEKVSLSITSAVQGEQTIDFALLAFSDIPDAITIFPSKFLQDPLFPIVPAPPNCRNHYPEFLSEITPFALYRVTDQVPNEARHNLARLEEGGAIIQDTLEWTTLGQKLVGAFAVKTLFTLPPSSYIYFQNQYGSKKLVDEVPPPVDASSFGTHVCLWIRFQENRFVDLTLFSNSTHQSQKQIYLPTSDWTNVCIEVSSMLVRKEAPADMSSLSQVLLSFTNYDSSESNFVMEYTMIYFTDEPKTYSIMPAVFEPGFILRENGGGDCEYVRGPNQATQPPISIPPKTPLETYMRSYDTDVSLDNRLAVFVIDEDSHWLALVHALKIHGIPLVVTRRWQDAIRHKTVLVYPEANDARLSGAEANRLRSHSRSNTVIFIRLNNERLHGVCGVTQTVESARDYSFVKFEQGVVDSPAELFGCDAGDKLADYDCPTGREDSERYVKIWEDWLGPYHYGLGRRTQRLQLSTEAEALATFTRRTPRQSRDGQYVYENEYVVYTEEDTSEVAVSRRSRVAGGQCYVVGVDLGELCSDSRNYDFEGMSRTYSSAYEPGIDMLLRMVKNIYTSSQEAVTLNPIPNGKRLAVMYTHDVDANTPDIWKTFALEEKKAGIRSTFMLYTKVSRDDYDVPFYLENEEALIEIINLGHELGSHSVSHSPNFSGGNSAYTEEYNNFPLGTGTEQYSYGSSSGYQPTIECTDASNVFIAHPISGEDVSVCDHPAFEYSVLVCNYWRRMNGSDEQFTCGIYETVGGTVLGDLRVSKFLIESVYAKAGIPGEKVRAFRPGHLLYPATLNEALESTGYRVSSVNQANELATHLYFRMLFGHDGPARNPETASGVNIFEMPIQFEDTVSWPLRASYSDVQGDFYDMATYTHHTAARIAKFGGIVVVLTHPTDESESRDGFEYTGRHKIEWEMEFTNNVRDYASFMTMSEIGDFVAARDGAEVDFQQIEGGTNMIKIEVLDKIHGLTLEVPAEWTCYDGPIVRQMPDHLDTSRSIVVLGELSPGQHMVSCN